MRRIKCDSGLIGWQAKLRSVYRNLSEFIAYDNAHGIASRIGFDSPQEAWKANPLIQGSVNPGDLRASRVKSKV